MTPPTTGTSHEAMPRVLARDPAALRPLSEFRMVDHFPQNVGAQPVGKGKESGDDLPAQRDGSRGPWRRYRCVRPRL